MLKRFQDLMLDAVLALPLDLKSVLRIVEDPEVTDSVRESLAGSLLHVISGDPAIPGVRGALQHVGSVLVIRLALERAQDQCPRVLERHANESPDLFEPMAEQLEAARDYLGEGVQVLSTVVDRFAQASHMGHSAVDCVHDVEHSTWLYDMVHVSLVEKLELDEDEVERELRNVGQIHKSLSSRVRSV